MSEVTIRPAREDELPAVGDVTFEAYRANGYLEGREDGYYARKLRDARPRYEEAELLVAVDEHGTVLGTVTIARPGTAWREIGRDGELEFRMLAVSPAARGRLDEAGELGCTAVVLSSSHLMVAAHRLYERLGFHRTPERDWSPEEGVFLVAYRLDL